MPRDEFVFDSIGNEVRSGDNVRVCQDSVVRSSKSYNDKVVSRAYVVRVDHVRCGYPATSPHRDDQGRLAEVVWAGSGGYWTHTPSSNVELVH
jgi:hypothetical protein